MHIELGPVVAENSGFVSGYRFGDTVSLSKSDAPLGATPW
jgi:hypothetical protein